MIVKAKDLREMYLNFKVASIVFHVILPIMYVADWFLFYERGKVKAYMPLLSICVPIVYVVFIYIRAWILDFNPNAPYIYPYFFLNIDVLGVGGVVKWIIILSIVFIIVGYIIFGLDKISKMQKVQEKTKLKKETRNKYCQS